MNTSNFSIGADGNGSVKLSTLRHAQFSYMSTLRHEFEYTSSA